VIAQADAQVSHTIPIWQRRADRHPLTNPTALFVRLHTFAMRADSGRSFSEGQPGTLRSRAVVFALVIAIELVILLGFATLRPRSHPPEAGQQTTVLQLRPPRPIIEPPETRRQGGSTAVDKPVAQVHPRPVPKPLTKSPQKMVLLSREDYAASDLGTLPSHGGGTKGDGDGSDSGPGDGPGGVHLYNARWQVEPKHGELALYLPHGAPHGSWATIACRTIADYHVEDCGRWTNRPVPASPAPCAGPPGNSSSARHRPMAACWWAVGYGSGLTGLKGRKNRISSARITRSARVARKLAKPRIKSGATEWSRSTFSV
jgi:protein TonB